MPVREWLQMTWFHSIRLPSAKQLVLELGPQVQVVSLVVVGIWGGIDVLPESDTLVGDTKLKSLWHYNSNHSFKLLLRKFNI